MNNSKTSKQILLIGCGNMGGAMLRGWTKALPETKFAVLDPNDISEDFKAHTHGKSMEELREFAAEANVVILAIKPQVMAEVCGNLAPHLPKTALILSIAAGQSIGNFENYFGIDQPIIRSMPNTPAAIGKGMTSAVCNPHVTPEQKDLADELLSAAGFVEWFDDENLINAITALTANGPAYVFYLIETLTNAGTKMGIDPELAAKLARQTVIGSAALAEYDAETPAATLRTNVTSPGGTTEAALKILMNGELDELFERALLAGKNRGEQLAS